jgi:hypothetical protein
VDGRAPELDGRIHKIEKKLERVFRTDIKIYHYKIEQIKAFGLKFVSEYELDVARFEAFTETLNAKITEHIKAIEDEYCEKIDADDGYMIRKHARLQLELREKYNSHVELDQAEMARQYHADMDTFDKQYAEELAGKPVTDHRRASKLILEDMKAKRSAKFDRDVDALRKEHTKKLEADPEYACDKKTVDDDYDEIREELRKTYQPALETIVTKYENLHERKLLEFTPASLFGMQQKLDSANSRLKEMQEKLDSMAAQLADKDASLQDCQEELAKRNAFIENAYNQMIGCSLSPLGTNLASGGQGLLGSGDSGKRWVATMALWLATP